MLDLLALDGADFKCKQNGVFTSLVCGHWGIYSHVEANVDSMWMLLVNKGGQANAQFADVFIYEW